MRDDDKDCGSIKGKKKRCIHPIFIEEFQDIYDEHMKLYYEDNKYLALFLEGIKMLLQAKIIR